LKIVQSEQKLIPVVPELQREPSMQKTEYQQPKLPDK
jgi:hypothetical protein